MTLSWSSTDTGLSYELIVDGTSYDMGSNTSKTLELADGNHSYKVIATNEHAASTTSPEQSFSFDATAPDAPENLAGVQEQNLVTLSWGAVADAASYLVEYSLNADFSGATRSTVTATELELALPAQSGQLYWRVKAVDAAGNEAAWTMPENALVLSPTIFPTLSLAAPAITKAGEGLISVTLSWSSVDTSLSYELIVDGTSYDMGSDTSKTLELADGNHSYKVIATNEHAASTTSPEQSFSFDATAPDAPEALSGVRVDGNIALSWAVVADAVRYIVEYGYDLSGEGVQSLTVNEAYAQFALPAVEGDLLWRVKAVDAAGNESAWVQAEAPIVVDTSVATIPQESLGLLAHGQSARFSWAAVEDPAGITGYRLEYATNAGFSNAQSVQVTGLEFTSFNLTEGITYYWRVAAIDGFGNMGAWTQGASFSTQSTTDDSTPDKSQALALTPAHEAMHSDWVGLGDATDYLSLNPTASGVYSVQLNRPVIESSIKLSIGQLNEEGEFVATRSLMVGPYSAHTGFEGLYLEAGEEYLVRVDAFDMGAGRYNSNYELVVSGEIADAHFITDNNSFELATALELSNQGDASTSGWVGAGDARDVYAFELFDAGAVGLSLSAMSAAAKLDVYQEMANGSMRRVSSQVVYSSGLDTTLNLSSGSYFLQVSSYDNEAGKYQSAYDLSINADDQKNKPGYIA